MSRIDSWILAEFLAVLGRQLGTAIRRVYHIYSGVASSGVYHRVVYHEHNSIGKRNSGIRTVRKLYGI